MHGEYSQSWMPPGLSLSCRRNRAFWCRAVIGRSQVQRLRSSLSLTVPQKKVNKVHKQDSPRPLLMQRMPQWPTKKQVQQSLSTAPPQSRLPCRALYSRRKTTRAWRTKTVLPPPLTMRVIALAIIRPPPKHGQHKTTCWKQKMRLAVRSPRRAWTSKMTAPHRTSLSPQSNEDRGLRPVQGELSPKSYGNHLLQYPSNRLVASLNTSNNRSHC